MLAHTPEQQFIEHAFVQPEIVVEPHTRLNIISLPSASSSQWTDEPFQRKIIVKEHAAVRVFTALFDSANIEIVGELEGDSSAFEHFVLYFGSGKQRMRIRTHTNHVGHHTLSRIVVHGAAIQQAQADFAGMINITKTGKGTDAHLEHEGLLLSRSARIDSLPGFEIHTDDVKAIHSSAVHYIRPEQLFYLQSRGIDEREAQQMIVGGFLEEMVSYMGHDELTPQVHSTISQKLSLL